LNGTNAASALDGEDGKLVKLELVPSSEGGFNAKGLTGKITSMTHIDAGFDLFVDARGSDGGDGGRGGDGLPGERGSDGKDATPHSDAVVRTSCDMRTSHFMLILLMTSEARRQWRSRRGRWTRIERRKWGRRRNGQHINERGQYASHHCA